MSTTNTKIWFLFLAAGALFCAGCATETAAQRDQRINRTLQAFIIQAQHTEEQISGKARKDWGPAEIAAYNALVLELIQYWHQAEQEGVARKQAQAAMIANGFQQAGEQIRQGAQTPVSQPRVNTPQMPREYVRRNAITGQLETVTEYGNGIQSVWPVGQ
jgi:hypothetical protein